ncbi:MAG: hypothetical protein ACMXX7_01120 [Candidatus Woesearchaeota archaeon]
MIFKDFKNNAALLFCISFLFMAFVLFQQGHLPQYDAYYHSAMAERVFEGDFFSQEFPWLQETFLKESYGNMHFLYHLILAPFTLFGFVGVKVLAALLASLFLVVFYFVLRRFDDRLAFFASFLMLTSVDFVFRLVLPRAISFNLILFFLGLYFLFKKDYKWLFAVGFVYAWSYTGFIFLIVLVLIYYFVNLHNSRNEYMSLVYSIGGVLAGLVFNPYFPSILTTYYTQIFKISVGSGVMGGGEWLPMEFRAFVLGNLFILILFFYAVIFFNKKDSTYQFLLIGTLVFGALTLISRRSIEIFVPLACAFIVYSFKDLKFSDKNRHFFGSFLFVFVLFGFLASAFFVGNVVYSNQNFLVAECAEFLKENSDKGDVVFNARWDDFPVLFYYNKDNFYLSGLDPNFMYFTNRDRFILHNNIVYGDEPLSRIKEFNSSFFVSIKDEFQGSIYERAELEDGVDLVFEGVGCYVLEVSS